MKQEMPDCKLCHAFIHDHLHTAITLSFQRRAQRILTSSVFLSDIVGEVTRTLGSCIDYRKFYEGALDQCATMETFHGGEATKEIFFESYPYMQMLVKHLEYTLFDIGAGKLVDIAAWAQEHVYILFRAILQLHKEHTKEVPVESLGAPLLYKPHTPAVKLPETMVILQELPEDDLYA